MKKYLLLILYILFASEVFADSYKSVKFINVLDDLKILRVNDDDYLYISKKHVKTPSEFYVLSIVGKAIVGNNTSYVIWGGSGGSVDNDYNLHYIFVNKDKNRKITVSKILPEAHDNNITINARLIKVKYHNDKPYSDKDDYGYYTYNPKTNKVIMTKPVKSDVYYNNKFAKYSAKQIVEQMKGDSCYYIDDDGLFSLPHSCNYGYGYCYMFKAMKNPIKDADYAFLKKSCANNY